MNSAEKATVAVYYCAKCSAEHKFTVTPEASPAKVIKIKCYCGNVLVIDDPTIRSLPKPDALFQGDA